MIEEFHFIRPWLLLFIPVGPGLIWLHWNRVSDDTNWKDVCDPHLIEHLLVGKQYTRSNLLYLIMAAAWIVASVAISGPTWEKIPTPLYQSPKSRVIVFDLSRSMDSTDIKPSRLTRARYKLTDLVLSGKELYQGLVVFAGDAFIVTPLTDDSDTIVNLIPTLDTETLPVQGSRADLGLRSAWSLYKNMELTQGEIILITDGANDAATSLASGLQSQGIRTSVMVVGSAEGGPVNLSDGTLLKDNNGNIVIPGVDYAALKQIAVSGGGHFVIMTSDGSDIDTLNSHTAGVLSAGMEDQTPQSGDNDFKSDQWKDNGPWLILPLLLLVALGFRRGWVLSIGLLMLPMMPDTAFAFGWQDLWLRSDQQAARQFGAGAYDQIGENAPASWKGAGKYRNNDFSGAADEFDKADPSSAITYFNKGNALAHNQSLEEALAAYDRALEIDSDFEDARLNRELVEKILQQINEQQQNDRRQQDSEQDTDQKSGQRQKQGNNQQQIQSAKNQQESDQGKEQQNQARSSMNDKSSDTDQDNAQTSNESDQNEEPYQSGNKSADATKQNRQVEQNREPQKPLSEQQQAMEQWLQKVPDDPGGLLKRKFFHQYSLRNPRTEEQEW